MSHQVEIKVQITDLEALRVACRELKLELKTGQGLKARTYNGNISADAVIVLPSAYDVALHRQKDGTYKMEVDFYKSYSATSKAADFIGENGGMLKQRYGICKAEMSARKLGFNTTRQTLKNGAVNVMVRGRF